MDDLQIIMKKHIANGEDNVIIHRKVSRRIACWPRLRWASHLQSFRSCETERSGKRTAREQYPWPNRLDLSPFQWRLGFQCDWRHSPRPWRRHQEYCKQNSRDLPTWIFDASNSGWLRRHTRQNVFQLDFHLGTQTTILMRRRDWLTWISKLRMTPWKWASQRWYQCAVMHVFIAFFLPQKQVLLHRTRHGGFTSTTWDAFGTSAEFVNT